MSNCFKNRIVQYAFCVGIIFVCLVSCKVGTPYERKSENLPQSYKYDFPKDSAMTNLSWWELYNDTVLVQLIDSALLYNKDIKIAISRIEQASIYMDLARADFYPQVNYGVQASSNKVSSSSSFNNAITPVVSASYTVDLWHRIKTLNDIALQNYYSSVEAYKALNISLITTVATAYISLRDIDNRLIISEKTAQNFQDNLDVMQARYNAGIISEVDLSQAKIQLSEAKTAIEVFKRLRGQTENGLSILLGRPPGTIPRGLPIYEQLAVPKIPVGIPSEILNRRPDILLAENQLHAQTLAIGVAEALQYPSLTINANLGAQLLNPTALFADLGTQLFGPLFNGGRIKANISLEQEKTKQAYFNYQNTYLKALKEVEDALIASETYKREYLLRNDQRELATKAAQLSWVRYDGGLTSYLEVLNLQSSQFSAELDASAAYTQEILSLIQLYEALGGGWNTEQ